MSWQHWVLYAGAILGLVFDFGAAVKAKKEGKDLSNQTALSLARTVIFLMLLTWGQQ